MATWIGIASLVFVAVEAPIYIPILLLGVLVPMLVRIAGVPDRGDDFILSRAEDAGGVLVRQASYYSRTPGHNPLLVNRFIEKLPARATATGAGEPPDAMIHSSIGGKAAAWQLTFPPTKRSAFDRFSSWHGKRPLVWTDPDRKYPYKDTPYWIVRCDKELISGHNDVWSQAAMDTYIEFHRLSMSADPPVT